MALLLSQITLTCTCVVPKSPIKPRSDNSSLITLVTAIYSASVTDKATVGCNIDLQLTGPCASVKAYPVVDLCREFLQFLVVVLLQFLQINALTSDNSPDLSALIMESIAKNVFSFIGERIGGRIVEGAGDRIVEGIAERVKHHRSLHESMNKLKRKCEELNCRKEDVELKINAALKPGKKLKTEVELWLATVQRINDKKQSIENEVVEVGEGRYLERANLGRLVTEMIQEVEELHQKGSFSDDLVVDAPPRRGEIMPTTKLAGETTTKKVEEIWAHLMTDDVRKIGVYGIGGSGKTAIMRQINNRILEETDEYSVIWVTMSKAVNVIKLQNDIASALNDEDIPKHEDETTKAAKIYSILRRERRYVLILDDVWEAFHLEVVGIPEPTQDNGCKLMLTTRSFDVCRNMSCNSIQMELLSKEEAWNLFIDKVGLDVLLTRTLEATMKLVAQECARLPLAIITIAGSMKGVVNECEWRNALSELRESTGGLNDMGKVLEQLKYSHNHLKDEKLRQCLLYCALFPEDFEIKRNELIEYLIDEGIIEGTSRQAEFDKGHSMLNKLENACLLESVSDGFSNKCVKMHDLIRDMALQIMGRGCMVKAGVQLKDVPDEEQWTEDLQRVSLMSNKIIKIHSGTSPRCSRLVTLLLPGNEYLERIPDYFFVHMPQLQVLDLSYTGIENLPNSISDLENLTALLLKGCWALKYVPSLAKLRALRKLDLYRTIIEELPQGMEMLVNLRYLNLYAKNLKMLPAGILPKLSRLQRLFIWQELKALNVKVEEVIGLRNLETFVGGFDNLHDFNMFARSLEGRAPCKYLIQVGPAGVGVSIDFYTEGSSLSKYVKLRKCGINKGGKDPLVLPKDIEELEIKECHYVRSLSDVLSLNNATDALRYCNIIKCNRIKCVLSQSSFSNCTKLQDLEVLQLIALSNLRMLFEGEAASPPPPLGTFSSLKELIIEKCPNIKNLFMLGFLPHLQNLEEIRVSECEGMEEIIAAKAKDKKEEQGRNEISNHSNVNNDIITAITLPKLRRLYLWGLPKLTSIISSRGIMVCDSLQLISVSRCSEMRKLFTPGLLSHLQSLKEIIVSDCCKMENIIEAEEEDKDSEASIEEGMGESISEKQDDDDGGGRQRQQQKRRRQQEMGESSNNSIVNDDDTSFTITLPKLQFLTLENLPNLKSIVSNRGMMVWDSVEKILVRKCPKLKRLPLSVSMLNGQPSPPPSLKQICIRDKKWWESVEWDHPTAGDVLKHYVTIGSGWQRR